VNAPIFDPAICNQAFRDRVSVIYGDMFDASAMLDERELFYLQLVADTGCLVKGKHLVDLGPGLSAFGPVAAALGNQVTLIDDYAGGGAVDVNRRDITQRFINGFRELLGGRVEEMDFVSQPLPLADVSVDVITCFHSLEHWHHSPKTLFREIVRVLKPGGHLIIATPNAANLRKRFFVPFGRNIWSSLTEWYHEGDPVFRGHVREPIVSELHQLLGWNQLELLATYGRNFIGRDSQALTFLPKPLVRAVVTGTDCILRFFPTLCSDIHVIGRKPA
jgi:SAM-dependent methyltransferase